MANSNKISLNEVRRKWNLQSTKRHGSLSYKRKILDFYGKIKKCHKNKYSASSFPFSLKKAKSSCYVGMV